jgi:predicted oxidoreductase
MDAKFHDCTLPSRLPFPVAPPVGTLCLPKDERLPWRWCFSGGTLYRVVYSGQPHVGRLDRDIILARRVRRGQQKGDVAWVQSKPIITAPIVGATKLHHLDDAIAALEEPYVPHEVVGFV